MESDGALSELINEGDELAGEAVEPVSIRPFDALTFSLGDLWP